MAGLREIEIHVGRIGRLYVSDKEKEDRKKSSGVGTQICRDYLDQDQDYLQASREEIDVDDDVGLDPSRTGWH
jgi:hypothetical protein